jgi:hypothetical protein
MPDCNECADRHSCARTPDEGCNEPQHHATLTDEEIDELLDTDTETAIGR